SALLMKLGASFTGLTLKLMAFGVGSRFGALPSSCTWKVKPARLVPLASAGGVYRSRPPLIAEVAIVAFAVTATPLIVNVPTVGSVVMITLTKLLAGLSSESLKWKSAMANV